MKTPTEVEEAVRRALVHAAANGFGFEHNTPEEIADDMMTYDAEVETLPRAQVIEAIKRVRS